MQTVTGLYDNYDDARTIVNKLEDAGISSSDITIVGRAEEASEPNAEEGVATGVGVGAVAGGAGGLIAGLGILAIPGLGPVVAAGWLVSTIVGAAAGAIAGGAAVGIIGSLIGAGVEKDEAHVYAEGIRRGSTLVSVRVDEDKVAIVRSIIKDDTLSDLEARRAVYREEGWQGFDETNPALTDEEVARERRRLREYRQQMP
jgi:hypothetical protein